MAELDEAGPRSRGRCRASDFYQYVATTRVIAGRDLLESTGFEFQKEGARRVFVVTDSVIRSTGLVERVEAGVRGRGLELAGVFDDVPQDSSTEVCERRAAKEAGADSFLAVGGGSVMDTAKVADAVFTHGGTRATRRASSSCPARTTAWGGRSRSLRSPASRPPRAPAARCRWRP